MKNLQLKSGSAKLLRKHQNGFSLNNWMFDKLKTLKTAPTRACCEEYHLKLKTGISTYLLSTNKNKAYFNFDKWFKKLLLEFGVINVMDIEDDCCLTKKTLFIHKSYLHFSKEVLENHLDLRKYVKEMLILWGITFTDPCCP